MTKVRVRWCTVSLCENVITLGELIGLLIYFCHPLLSNGNHFSSNMYKVALPLHTPEMLSLLSKSRIFVCNAHLALFVRRMTQLRSHNPFSKYFYLVN